MYRSPSTGALACLGAPSGSVGCAGVGGDRGGSALILGLHLPRLAKRLYRHSVRLLQLVLAWKRPDGVNCCALPSSREMISCWISAVPLEDVVGWWRLAADGVARKHSVFESPNRVIASQSNCL